MTQDAKTLNEDALTKAIWKFQERTGGFGPDDDANIVTDIIKSYLAALTRNAEPVAKRITEFATAILHGDESGWVQADDEDEMWSPKWWMPYEAIPEPQPAPQGKRA